MSFLGDLLKEKALWWAIGGALTVYFGTVFLARYYGPMGGNTNFLPDNSSKIAQYNNSQATSSYKLEKPDFILKPGVDYKAVISTEYGDIQIDLLEKDAPNIVNNFVYLVQKGFYNNITWHRVITNFIIQTGDPTGTGNGGPGYYVKGDFSSNLPKYAPGIVGMANDGNKDHNGSQFFIVASKANVNYMSNWNGVYPVFGRVISGMDIVDKIASIQADKNGKPIKTVRVYSIKILEN